MAAYVIGHITVKDADAWNEYRSKVPATLAPWGAEVVLRGKRLAVLSGEHSRSETVVLRFPSADAITGWYGSPAYQALAAIRARAADVDLVSFDGG